MVRPDPNGETVIYMQESDISPRAAEGLGCGLTTIKQQYHATGLMQGANA